MSILNILVLFIIPLATPFIIYFCGKWGAFGWFRGKQLAENKKRQEIDHRTVEDTCNERRLS